jgi:hypothetical protein
VVGLGARVVASVEGVVLGPLGPAEARDVAVGDGVIHAARG